MRITNKIMQNNSLYNINNNKVTEDSISTSIMTGKKINRPSEDPVIAIRSLRLRANVTELNQYYEKNAEDAKAWLKVTEGALDTTNAVLTDLRNLVVSGPDKYKTISDWETIVTQIESLSDEYYATGNVDYAGRYIFTGYRTDTTLTFNDATSLEYKNIVDEFNATDIDSSDRVTKMSELADGTPDLKESDMQLHTVGRLRTSYDVVNATNPDDLNVYYRENMVIPATSTVYPETKNVDAIDLSFTDDTGKSHTVHIPESDGTSPSPTINILDADGNVTETYSVTSAGSGATKTYTVTGTFGTFVINARGVITNPSSFPSGQVAKASASISSTKVAEVTFTASGSTPVKATIPLVTETKLPYQITLANPAGHTVTVNTDGTYTLKDTATGTAPNTTQNIVQLTRDGSAHSCYVEKGLEIDQVLTNTSTASEIDTAYEELKNGSKNVVFNADTGELLFSDTTRDRLMSLKGIINANTIRVVYDKTEFKAGDTRPQNLFTCTYDGVIYNSGTSGHVMSYDVGYNQRIDVNTMAEEVFTNDVRRNAEDLRRILSQMKDVEARRNTLKGNLENATTDPQRETIQMEIDAATKALDYLTEVMKDEFSSKITGFTNALEKANVAVTTNGTRSRRLELVQSRLMDQTATFEELQSENEDVDLAEAGTMLSMARLTYEASLSATGKIMTTSLMDYI